ncbi:MAG: AAA family ATPase [Cellvibrionaceae bacterium]
MYLEHFQLEETPFSLTPDTQFFFDQHSHQEALNTILIALKSREGFVKVVGEVGTGKTILGRKLLRSLGGDFISAYLPNPYLSPDELKAYLAAEIKAPVSPEFPAHEVLLAIYRRLIQLARKGKQVVFVIDEAQSMPRDTIETLRLLTNMETEKRKLLQVVLLGQPELDTLLNRPDLRQLKQRIIFNEELKPLSFSKLKDYVSHRIQSAGYDQAIPLFTDGALKSLHSASGGIPRLVNVLSHKALLSAFGQGHYQVARSHVSRAIQDTDEVRWKGRLAANLMRWLPLTAAVAMVVPFIASMGLLPLFDGGLL